MKKPAYVIFDMDGLMFNTEALGERCMRTSWLNTAIP